MAEKGKKKEFVNSDKAVEEGKSIAWLSYLGILLLIPLLVKPDNPFCKHHAKQGLVMLLLWIGLWIISNIPILGWFIGIIGWIILVILAIIGIVQSLLGSYWKAPLGIYQLSEKFNF
ncbi:hypothetical protein KAX08_08535 [candidate division WOR-3 bacterium]|nr:hypothetical protein [candidate division WOR-3 bacterium]